MGTASQPLAATPGAPVGSLERGDAALLRALRARDERAFMELVRRHHGAMVRIALAYVPSRSIAEEVVQETWLAALNGLDRFEGRASIKTWLFGILVNRAKTRGVREARSVPFSSLAREDDDEIEPAVEAARFVDRDQRWGGHWTAPPQDWRRLPEQRLLSRETMTRVREAIDQLPVRQREVIALRDLVGCSSQECCDVLGLSEGNQRVLLHRARSKVRQALEEYMDGADRA